MIKKIVTQRGVEFEVGQAAPSSTDWTKVNKIEYVPGETGDLYVASLENGHWVSVINPAEVWYEPDDVPAAEA